VKGQTRDPNTLRGHLENGQRLRFKGPLHGHQRHQQQLAYGESSGHVSNDVT